MSGFGNADYQLNIAVAGECLQGRKKNGSTQRDIPEY